MFIPYRRHQAVSRTIGNRLIVLLCVLTACTGCFLMRVFWPIVPYLNWRI